MLSIIISIIGLFTLLYLFMICPNLSGKARMKPFQGVEWAHRGLHDLQKGIPENSMAAFQNAVKGGFGIELDVHLTRDGQLVVFHDDTLRRVCGKAGMIEEMFYSDLQQLYLCGTAERIPLLSQVLSYVQGRVPLLIEVKLSTQNTLICDALKKNLNKYSGAYLIQSFNCFVLHKLRTCMPQALRGQLSSNLTKSDKKQQYFLRLFVKCLLTNCYTLPDFISYKLGDSKNISLWLNQHLYKVPIAVWTLRGEKELKKAKNRFDMYIFERK